MKEHLDIFQYAPDILKSLRSGILLTSKGSEKINSMVIGWGTIGIEWGKPIFIAFIRSGRYTRACLDQNPEFTINAPYGEERNKRIIAVAGGKSGRNVDKIAELGLTLEAPEVISVPGIREMPLTLECRIIYQQLQDRDKIGQDMRKKFYPQHVESDFPMANKDYHIAYYGEIVASYIIKEI